MDYQEYINYQVGGGLHSGIGRVYVGAPYQRGSGIGSFLGGVFRYVLPLLKRGARAVGKEALTAGMNIMSDVTERNASLNEAFNSRIRESGEKLKRKAEERLEKLMEGQGYRTKRVALAPHLLGAVRAVTSEQVGRKRRKRRVKRRNKKKSVKRIRRRGKAVKKKTKKRNKKRANTGRKRRKSKQSFNDIFK